MIIMKQKLKEIQTQIPECLKLWKRESQSIDAAFAQYKASRDKDVFKTIIERGNAAFQNYKECFKKNVTLQLFFPKIKALAEATVGQIE